MRATNVYRHVVRFFTLLIRRNVNRIIMFVGSRVRLVVLFFYMFLSDDGLVKYCVLYGGNLSNYVVVRLYVSISRDIGTSVTV